MASLNPIVRSPCFSSIRQVREREKERFDLKRSQGMLLAAGVSEKKENRITDRQLHASMPQPPIILTDRQIYVTIAFLYFSLIFN